MTKTFKKNHSKKLAVLLLALWFVILFGNFVVPLMAHGCLMHDKDCSSEFLHEAKSVEYARLLIQFGFFFFVAAVCKFCFPEGIIRTSLEPAFSGISNFIKVLSPPPRFSHI
jgi:hypothetical protein